MACFKSAVSGTDSHTCQGTQGSDSYWPCLSMAVFYCFYLLERLQFNPRSRLDSNDLFLRMSAPLKIPTHPFLEPLVEVYRSSVRAQSQRLQPFSRQPQTKRGSKAAVDALVII